MPTKDCRFNRRDFAKLLGFSTLAGLSILPAIYYLKKKKKHHYNGKIAGANAKTGHLLREKINHIPEKVIKINTIIVGGGISGLSTAWSLKKNKKTNFLLLEMDTVTGGNSQSGENHVSKYPWGAHYVPLPNIYDLNVKELFEDFNIITGYQNGVPVINEYFLCADPQERLFYQGKWQEGLVPTYGVSDADKEQYKEFFSYTESLKNIKGSDGKYLFSIPLDLSSSDDKYRSLDKISMHQFLTDKKWDSKPLLWYINYCCRDDFGVGIEKVSAWAGLHYFCSRIGKCVNSDSAENITWPEGNGWLASKLKEFSHENIRCNQLVYNIEVVSDELVYVDSFNTQNNTYTRFEAENVVYCGPRFTARNIIKSLDTETIKELTYSPWLTANITLASSPSGEGAPLSWDNVNYYSDSLGYIVANHQGLKINQKETVITYYLPLDKLESLKSRHSAYRKSFDDWVDIVVPDLEKSHSGISKQITNIDVWIWGHGMISPGIDYLWSDKRQAMQKSHGPVQFAHSDMSGISIFEEALYQGCKAAKSILRKSGV